MPQHLNHRSPRRRRKKRRKEKEEKKKKKKGCEKILEKIIVETFLKWGRKISHKCKKPRESQTG